VSVYVQRYQPTDPRLGRHIEHDARSLSYAHHVLPKAALKPVDWTRRIPILDQGQIGSCTGNALTGVLGTDSAGRTATTQVTITTADSKKVFTAGTYTLDEAFAVTAYELNTLLDTIPGAYPAEDTGSTSLAAGKSGQQLGLLSGYTHAFSDSAMKTALQTGPVLIGIPWYQSMFDAATDGTVTVDKRSSLAGGHGLAVSAWDGARYRIDNSWGTSWGAKGSGWISETDMTWLLSQGGDVLVPAFTTTPTPSPSPIPAPAPAVADQALAAAAHAWLTAKGL
jgi:hypothetical protein